MKRYSAAHARKQFADLLTEADRGVPVVIERRGARYVLRAEPAPRRGRTRPPAIETIDPAIDRGQWQWTWTAKGVRFSARRSRT